MCFDGKAGIHVANQRCSYDDQHFHRRQNDVNDVKRRKKLSMNVEIDHDARIMNDYPSLPRSPCVITDIKLKAKLPYRENSSLLRRGHSQNEQRLFDVRT